VVTARREGARVRGCVAAIDTWGNLITNIDAPLLDGLHRPLVSIGPRDVRLVTTYGAAPPGALLAVVNSFGTVEVAWREGNAAAMLGLGRGAPVTIEDAPEAPAGAT
jgi:S-adenosylmethionine hydrolase